MLDEQREKLWKKLNELVTELEAECGHNHADDNLSCSLFQNDKPLAEFKLYKSTIGEYFRRQAFEELESIFSKFNDEDFVKVKIDYFKTEYDLNLDAAMLKQLYLSKQASVLWTRESNMVGYLEYYFNEMCRQAVEWFAEEARLTITNDTDLIWGYSKLGTELYQAPFEKDVQDRLLKPFKKKLKTRLGWAKGKRHNLTTFQLIEAIVPLYRKILRELEELKEHDGKGLQGREKILHALAIRHGGADDPHLKACEALIETENLPYKPRSLYNVILKAIEQEETIVEKYKKSLLNDFPK